MKKANKIVAVALAGCLAAFGCAALAGCGGGGAAEGGDYKLVEDGKLTIGSDLDFPPMEYLDGGQPAGFGIAMITEICNRIGLEPNVLPPQNFDTLITQVSGGTSIDVAVSSMTITDEREELVDFSTPYYDSNLAIVRLAEGNAAVDDLNVAKEELSGAKIGVQSGSSGEAWAKENLAGATITPYNGPSDALAALRTGDITAVIYDLPVAANHVANEYSDCIVYAEIPTGEQYGIAVNKDNAALTEAINQALADMEADGTMDKLKAEWIG